MLRKLKQKESTRYRRRYTPDPTYCKLMMGEDWFISFEVSQLMLQRGQLRGSKMEQNSSNSFIKRSCHDGVTSSPHLTVPLNQQIVNFIMPPPPCISAWDAPHLQEDATQDPLSLSDRLTSLSPHKPEATKKLRASNSNTNRHQTSRKQRLNDDNSIASSSFDNSTNNSTNASGLTPTHKHTKDVSDLQPRYRFSILANGRGSPVPDDDGFQNNPTPLTLSPRGSSPPPLLHHHHNRHPLKKAPPPPIHVSSPSQQQQQPQQQSTPSSIQYEQTKALLSTRMDYLKVTTNHTHNTPRSASNAPTPTRSRLAGNPFSPGSRSNYAPNNLYKTRVGTASLVNGNSSNDITTNSKLRAQVSEQG